MPLSRREAPAAGLLRAKRRPCARPRCAGRPVAGRARRARPGGFPAPDADGPVLLRPWPGDVPTWFVVLRAAARAPGLRPPAARCGGCALPVGPPRLRALAAR